MGLEVITENPAQYTWASNINGNFDVIDTHDHSPGNGVAVKSSSVLFLNDVKISGTIQNIACLGFVNSTSKKSTSATVFSFDGDFYFNDGNNRAVQITAGNSVNNPSNTGSAGIGGEYVSAAAVATYSSSTETYSWYNGGSVLSTLKTVDALVSNVTLSGTLTYTSDSNFLISGSDRSNLDFNLPVDGLSAENYVPVLDLTGGTLTISTGADYVTWIDNSTDTTVQSDLLCCEDTTKIDESSVTVICDGNFYSSYYWSSSYDTLFNGIIAPGVLNSGTYPRATTLINDNMGNILVDTYGSTASSVSVLGTLSCCVTSTQGRPSVTVIDWDNSQLTASGRNATMYDLTSSSTNDTVAIYDRTTNHFSLPIVQGNTPSVCLIDHRTA